MYSKFPVLIALLFCGFPLVAQTKKGDVNKDVDITKVYEQVVKEGYGTTLIYADLANAHYFKSNYAEAKKWFEKLFSEERSTDATLRFRYKQSLKALSLDTQNNKYLKMPMAISSTN